MKGNRKSILIIGAMVLLLFAISLGFQYINTPPELRNSKKSPDEEEGHHHPSISGMPVVDFTMPSISGNVVSLSNYKNKYNVILVFTSIKDPNIDKLIAALQRLEKKYANDKVKAVVVTSLYPIAEVREFARKNHVPLNLLADKTGSVYMQYMQIGETNAFIVDIKGNFYAPIKARNPQEFEAKANELLQRLIRGEPAPDEHEEEHGHTHEGHTH